MDDRTSARPNEKKNTTRLQSNNIESTCARTYGFKKKKKLTIDWKNIGERVRIKHLTRKHIDRLGLQSLRSFVGLERQTRTQDQVDEIISKTWLLSNIFQHLFAFSARAVIAVWLLLLNFWTSFCSQYTWFVGKKINHDLSFDLRWV